MCVNTSCGLTFLKGKAMYINKGHKLFFPKNKNKTFANDEAFKTCGDRCEKVHLVILRRLKLIP